MAAFQHFQRFRAADLGLMHFLTSSLQSWTARQTVNTVEPGERLDSAQLQAAAHLPAARGLLRA